MSGEKSHASSTMTAFANLRSSGSFREYFDYDLAGKVDKDDNLLIKAGGLRQEQVTPLC